VSSNGVFSLAPSCLSLSISGCQVVNSFALPHSTHDDVLHRHNPETMELSDHGLQPQTVSRNKVFLLLSWFPQVFVTEMKG
jgi:hypothetical protein